MGITYKHKLLKAIKGSLVLLFMPFIIMAQTCPGPIINATSNLNYRTAPIITPSTSLGTFSSGKRLIAFNEEDDWYEVDVPTSGSGANKTAWMANYMQPDPTVQAVLTVSQSVNNGLAVRTGASSSHPQVGWGSNSYTYVWKYQQFPVVGHNSVTNWFMIDLPNNCSQTTGWVSGDFVTYEYVYPDDCGGSNNDDIDVGITSYGTSPTNPMADEDTDLEVSFKNHGDVTVDVEIRYYVDGNYIDDDNYDNLQSGITGTAQESNYVFTSTTCRDVTIRLIVAGDTDLSNNEVTFEVCPEEPCELPTINNQPSGDNYCVGDNTTLSVSASGPGSESYRWYKDGLSISGATGSSYSINSLDSNDAANYYCRVSNSCGYTNSNTVTVSVSTCSPTVDFSSNTTYIIEGESVNFFNNSTNYSSSSWSFSGGSPSSSTANNPTNITYNSPGCYEVTLEVFGATSGEETVSCFITVLPDYGLPIPDDMSLSSGFPTELIADPVNPATGEYYWTHWDLAMQTRTGTQQFIRSYKGSKNDVGRGIGYGWSHNFDTRIDITDTLLTVRYGDQSSKYFVPYETYIMPRYTGILDSLVKNANNSYTLMRLDGQEINFDSAGRITSQIDENGNQTLFSYGFFSGQLNSVTFPGGRTFQFTYSGGLLTTVTDVAGRTVSYSYSPSGDLTQVEDATGGITTYTYDANHRITSITDPNGNVIVQNTYDAQGRVIEQLDVENKPLYISYDTPVINSTRYIDVMGDTSYYRHDENNRLIESVDAMGNEENNVYDDNHLPTQIIDANWNSINITRDENGNPTEITDAMNKTRYRTYDSRNNLTSTINTLGDTTSMVYDANDNLTDIYLPDGAHVIYTYNSYGKPTSVTDGNGNVTTYTYNTNGDLIFTTTGDGTVSYGYDALGRLTSVTALNGSQSTIEYTNYDKVTKVTDALGNFIENTYDANGNLKTYTDKKGNTTSFDYDAKDRLISITDALQGITEYQYDDMNNLISTIDANGNIITNTYDKLGQRTQTTNTLGTTNYTYNKVGDMTRVVDADSVLMNFNYNRNHDLISTLQDNDWPFIAWNYFRDSEGNLSGIGFPGPDEKSYTYDEMNRLTTVTDEMDVSTNYTLDLNGNPVTIEAPNGNTTNTTYDHANRPLTRTDSEGNTTSWTYTNGNLISVTYPNSTTISYQYDALNRPVQMTYSTGETYTITYDANDNPVSMTNASGTMSMTYDALNRLTSVTDVFGNQIQYGYDAVGNKTSITYPNGNIVTYTYNGVNQISSVTDWLNSTTTYTYDAAGKLETTTFPNGVTSNTDYDTYGRLIEWTNQLPNNEVINSSILSLYKENLRNEKTWQGPDDMWDLTEQDINYEYQSNDRLINTTDGVFTNDANGNRIQQILSSSDSTAYNFSQLQQLQSVMRNTEQLQYTYSPTGDRIKRIKDGIETQFVVDINVGLTQILAEMEGATTKAQYIYGNGLIARIDQDNNIRYYHDDEQGNTIALTDENAEITDTYTYLPFGEMVKHNGDTDQPFQFLGKQGIYAEGDNFYHIRARYYDANTGRFISEDPYPPSFTDPQTLNRYIYALNNPISLVDVNGLFAQGDLNYGGSCPLEPNNGLSSISIVNNPNLIYANGGQCYASSELDYGDVDNLVEKGCLPIEILCVAAIIGTAISQGAGTPVAVPICSAATACTVADAFTTGLEHGQDIRNNDFNGLNAAVDAGTVFLPGYNTGGTTKKIKWNFVEGSIDVAELSSIWQGNSNSTQYHGPIQGPILPLPSYGPLLPNYYD